MKVLHLRKRSDERGAAAVEFAILAPLLFVILFGIIDFGFIFNNYISLRQGSRDGARAGIVADVGSSSTCGLTGAGEATLATAQLMCLTKDRVGLGDETRVKVLVGPGGYTVGEPLVVCAQLPLRSISGFLSSVIPEGVLQTKVQMRTERIDTSSPIVSADEDSATGDSWSWCSVS